jgi:putative transposase
MKKTYKYRIYLNKKTQVQTEKVLELCRQVYNLCLEQKIFAWKNQRKNISYFDQKEQLPELKEVYPEFKQVPSQTLQNVIERLDKAYQGFFIRIKKGEKAGFPRFKGINRYDSITLTQAGWKLEANKLVIKKIGIFKLIKHREMEGRIKTITIKRTLTNKWYVYFSCDGVPLKLLPKADKSIGIDVGCTSFLTDSDGNLVENPRFLNKSKEILTKRQQKLSRRIKGSIRRSKARLLVAKIYEKIRNQRRDFHFKVANRLVKENDTICIEKMKSFKAYKGLNRSMKDVAWFGFFDILRFKAEEAGKEVIEVPAKNTSQMCSNCGEMVQKELSNRIHECPFCGFTTSRDLNSAQNILRLGMSLQRNLSEKPPDLSQRLFTSEVSK